MSTPPGEGERRAAGGYRPQYRVGAQVILTALGNGNLEWIRIADPEAGRVDDLQVGTTSRVDAYQVKWNQYPESMTFLDLVRGSEKEPPLVAQLADGWRRLRGVNSPRRVVVHLTTNAYPSTSTSARIPISDPLTPSPAHFSAFIEQAWRPAHRGQDIDIDGAWGTVWDEIAAVAGLTIEELPYFVRDCSLDFGTNLPEDDADLAALADLLFETAASPERVIELSRTELLQRLGWTRRYSYRSIHEFPPPRFRYRPIETTVSELETALQQLSGGYVGVFGPFGSGKSTLLTRTLRSLPLRLIPYYAYVPEAQDPSTWRGESVNFLHDMTLRLAEAGIVRGKRPDPSDRGALLARFHEQLQALGNDYIETETKTVLLVDGLDHIEREQHPERSLLRDLPLPEAIPEGVYIVVGSRTDELEGLPPQAHYELRQEARRIEMGRLSPSDVHAIAGAAVPDLSADERQQIFQLSDGHPLALLYLLKKLETARDPEEREEMLEEGVPYEGDIEAQYWVQWREIERNDDLVRALGLLARIRGPIPMEWVDSWLEAPTLREVSYLLPLYFQEEGAGRWIFVHNSFRLFLAEQTADPLPGQTRESVDRAYHRELAELYEDSPEPWQWESLYHRFSAGDNQAVTRMATIEWFRNQVESLRPLDAVETDVRLAFKAAGECRDIVALVRLTLIAASLEQRASVLEDTSLLDLLLMTSQIAQTAEHVRDGTRLRVEPEQALRLCPLLLNAGLTREAQRVFELAEPLEFLSGRIIPSNTRNLWPLLREWVQSAVSFRDLEEVVAVIRRIRVEPRPGDEKDVVQASEELQHWLLFQGILELSESGRWLEWQTLLQALESEQDPFLLFFALLRSAERADDNGENERAVDLLERALAILSLHSLSDLADTYQAAAGLLSAAELIMRLTEDEGSVRSLAQDIPPLPLVDHDIREREGSRLQHLRFRRARLLYLLDEGAEPRSLVREAESFTVFGHTPDEEQQVCRQGSLAVYHLARLWAWGRQNRHLQPAVFMREVEWILDLFGDDWMSTTASVRLHLSGSRPTVLRYTVLAAAQHGDEVLSALRGELEQRWTDAGEADACWPGLQRELIIELVDAGVDARWAARQLERIASTMLHGLDVYSRVEECEKQAEAWLALNNFEAALEELGRMTRTARGIQSDEDYQLTQWVDWLDRISELQPEPTEARIRLMLRRIMSVEDSSPSVRDAAEELVEVVFKWKPRRATLFLKELLEQKLITHLDGVTHFFTAALSHNEPPTTEILWAITYLVIPLVKRAKPELLEALIVQLAEQRGVSAAASSARIMADCIKSDALSDLRSGWLGGIVDGLEAINQSPASAGMTPADLEDVAYHEGDNRPDKDLYLRNDEQLTLEQVLGRLESVGDLRVLLEQEDRERTEYFDWSEVARHLSGRLSTGQELQDLESLLVARVGESGWSTHRLSKVFTALSEGYLDLGEPSNAWQLAERALDLTEASGWVSYFDSGARHAALRQMVAIDPEQARDTAVRIYAQDFSESFYGPQRVIQRLHEVLALLTEEIPVAEIWQVIENYLDELFAGVPVEPCPSLEAFLDEPMDILEEETPGGAVALLLVLYLDHPSFVVAQRAVQACAFALLDGSHEIATALNAALEGNEQTAERALMVLDAVSFEDPSAVTAGMFGEALERLSASPNMTLRFLASVIQARIQGTQLVPERVDREVPAIYSLHLPQIALHDTADTTDGESSPLRIGDPARRIQPVDMEARAVAGVAGLPEDNVLYRAATLLEERGWERNWLAGDDLPTSRQLSHFLDRAGLRHSFYKPQIVPARQALAWLVAELYDGGYLQRDAFDQLVSLFVHHDPVPILHHPVRRPTYIEPIGDIDADETNYITVTDSWLDSAENSFALLHSHTPEGRLVVGEWTRLRYLEQEMPQEDRMAVVRLVDADDLWAHYDVERAYPPFYRVHNVRVADYLNCSAPLDHLVITNSDHFSEMPNSQWLALNPAVGRLLGWQPITDGWFQWANQKGVLVAESVWWRDGPAELFDEHVRAEVGRGWLVLVTETGVGEIQEHFTNLSRGGVVWRSLGQLDLGRRAHVQRMLPF